ncbi:MAG: sulfotransferase [Hyphomicrobiales bacterium]
MSTDSIRQAEIQFKAALAAQNAGKRLEAEALYLQVLNLNPKSANALHNLGLLILERGHSGGALPYLKYSIEINPKAPEAHNTYGNALWNVGFKDEAEAEYRKAIELKPNYAVAWRGLGRVFAETNRPAQAEDCYRKALEANPRYRDVLINLGNMLRYKNPEEAIALTRRALEVDPKSALAHNNMGNFLRDLDKLDEAAECYRKSVEYDPQHFVAWLNLGTVLNHIGKTTESADALRTAIEIDPSRGEPYFQLAVTVKLKMDDPAVLAMRRLYGDPNTPDADRMYLAFGLGRTFDANKLYDDAFACWHIGNKLKRAGAPFNIQKEQAVAARVCQKYTREFLATAPRSTVTDNTPIFIVGMIRSGTTLMEQILASHPQVVGADENTIFPELAATLKDHTEAEFTRIGQGYIDRMRERYGRESPRISDKLVGNWLHAGLISLALPNAKIICMRRNPYDSCISAYGSLFSAFHEYCYGMEDVAKFYNIFKNTIAHWEEAMPGRIFQQRYETLIAHPEEEVRKILDFCELPFDERCLAFDTNERRVRTASAQQVREKIHSRSVERWRNYERHIQPWRPILGDPEAWSAV